MHWRSYCYLDWSRHYTVGNYQLGTCRRCFAFQVVKAINQGRIGLVASSKCFDIIIATGRIQYAVDRQDSQLIARLNTVFVANIVGPLNSVGGDIELL